VRRNKRYPDRPRGCPLLILKFRDSISDGSLAAFGNEGPDLQSAKLDTLAHRAEGRGGTTSVIGTDRRGR
jgi:hypothetical protein